jgi:WD40 repeat protein
VIPAVAAPPSPFKGLAPFDDSDLDALLFFGREHESEIIAANLMAARVTVLYGPSGVGKTSVLRAGVAYRLRREEGVEVVVFSSWPGDPVRSLIDAIGGGGSLADACADAANRAGGDLYLILDQFEEYFLYHDRNDALVDALAQVVRRPGVRVHFLIGIREETLAQLDSFKAAIPNLLANRLRLQRLDRAAGEAAITGPVRRYNELAGGAATVSVEPELVDAVLDEVAAGRVELSGSRRGVPAEATDAGRIEAPYLQLVMARLWELELARSSRTLRLATLRELGGAAQIVEDHLEHAMAELTAREKDVAAAMYRFLVTPSGTKIAHDVRDLADYAKLDEQEADRVLRRLGAERIVRSDSTNGAPLRYEIYHDVLADAVVAWRNRHDAEHALREAERRRRRAFAVATAALIALVLVAGIAVYALVERGRSRAEARRAHARELAAAATGQLDTDPQRSVALAAEAARLEPGRHEEDVLRNALLAANQRAVMRAGGPVSTARFDPQGAHIATASTDGRVRIYRVGAGTPQRVLEVGSPVTALHYSPDGRTLLIGARDGTVRVAAARGGHTRDFHAGGPVVDALFVEGSTRVVTLTRTGIISLWRREDGRRLLSFRVGGAALPRRAAVSPAGGLLVVVGHDRFARVYSLLTGLLVNSLPHLGRVECATFVPNGAFLLTCDHAGYVRVWSTVTGGPARILRGPKGRSAIVDAAVSPNGILVAGAVTDGTIRVWEIPTGFQTGVGFGHLNPVVKVAFSPTGGSIATASTDNTARTWLKNGKPVASLVGHRDRINDVEISPDGRYVATASDDTTARLWLAETEPDLVLLARQRPITAFAVSRDGRRTIAGDGRGVARVRAVGRRHVVALLRLRRAVTAVAFGAGGRPLAVARPFSSIAYSPATGALARGRFDGSIVINAEGRAARTLRVGHRAITAVAFSPDGSVVAAGDAAGFIRRWDLPSGESRAVRAGHRLAVTSLTFAPGGRLLLSAGRDGAARVWNAGTLQQIRALHWHFGPLGGASFSEDGRWIVTAGPTSASLGATATGRRLLSLKAGATRPLVAAAFGGVDHRLILTAARDGSIRSYRCNICGGLDELLADAKRRLAAGR